MAASDAKPFPKKNEAYRVTFPIFDADGDLVTGAADLDSEISKDGGTFADCTNEATEIATSSGMYYLDLTSTEMNADTVAIIVKTSTSGAKTTPLVMYPVEDGDIPVNVRQIEGADPSDTIRDAVVDDATRIDASALNTLSGHDPGATLSSLTAAQVNTEVDTALADIHLDHLLATDYDPASKPGVATALLNELIESDAGVSRFTANALEQAPSGSGVGDWTSGEKEQIRYRLQLDGTQTAPATDAPLQMPVSADAVSQDETAAGSWKSMLDGTRAKLYLSQLDIQASGNDAAVKAFGSGLGQGVFIKGGSAADAHGMRIQGVGTGCVGLFIVSDSEADGMKIISNGANRNGLTLNGSQGGSGLYAQGGGSGAGIKALGLTGLDIDGDITGNLSGSIGSLAAQAKDDVNAEAADALATYDPPTKAELDAAQASIEALINALNNLSASEVKAKVVEALATDTIAEMSSGAPPSAPTIKQALMYLYMALRNASETERTGATTLLRKIRNAAGTVIAQGSMTQSSTSLNQGTLEAPPETP